MIRCYAKYHIQWIESFDSFCPQWSNFYDLLWNGMRYLEDFVYALLPYNYNFYDINDLRVKHYPSLIVGKTMV